MKTKAYNRWYRFGRDWVNWRLGSDLRNVKSSWRVKRNLVRGMNQNRRMSIQEWSPII